MRTSRITALAATLFAAVSLTVGAVAPAANASVAGIGMGTGSTAAAAHDAASNDLVSNYFGCVPARGNLVFDTEGSNGIWSAEVAATCQGFR